MRIDRFALALALCSASGSIAAAPPEMVQPAENLFAITCSSSFCHGPGGVGARGPALRNRDFTADFVRSTMLNGRSGTPMPSFRNSLNPAEIDALVAYVMSLSPNSGGGTRTASAVSAPAPVAAPPAPLSAQAQRGARLFFDQTDPAGCSLCHSYGGRGGPVGPDLATVATRTPSDLLAAMRGDLPAEAGLATAVVRTADGKQYVGVIAERSDKAIRIYDLSSVPPVLRTFAPPDAPQIDAATAKAGYRHDLGRDTPEQLADLIAFLRSASGDPKAVTPQDLGKR